MKMTMSLVIGSACALVSTSAFAQEAAVSAQATPPAAAVTPPPPAPRVVEAAPADESPDHERFIGHFAVGYFGISQLPIATGGPAGGGGGGAAATGLAIPPAAGVINAPVIGGRYWINRQFGIDAGLGFAMTNGSTEQVQGAQSTSTDHISTLGFALHGGVPIAFASGKHFTFELIPEATLGIASGSIKTPTLPGAAAIPDQTLSGFRFDLGARVGAEIHFGFMGIPELALQGSVGLYFRRQSIKWSQGNDSTSDGQTSIATSVQSDPWALFVNYISALEYF